MKSFPVLCAFAVFLAGCGRVSHPSDDALIQRFNDQRKQFEELVQMIQQDRFLTRVSMDFTRPDDAGAVGVTPERLQKYRDLLRTIQVPLGIAKSQQGTQVRFIVSGSGLGVSGSGKGYLYSTNPPAPLLDNLDTYVPADNISPAYRLVVDNWYLWAD